MMYTQNRSALSVESAREAADLLWANWRAGTVMDALPSTLRPASREEGYLVQSMLARPELGNAYGWKIAATSVAGQAHIGVDRPIAGRVFEKRVVPDGGCVPFHPNRMAVAEVEFAFRMGADLAPRPDLFTAEEVAGAVCTFHPAIEIPDSRYEDFSRVGAAQLIADGACGHYFVEGGATDRWRSVDLIHLEVAAAVNGQVVGKGSGAAVLGDPLVALTWLANELRGLGITLARGQIVTTGACISPISVLPSDEVIVNFGSLGRASVTFE